MHHFYIGIIAVIAAWFSIFELSGTIGTVITYILAPFGLYMITDDLYQHYKQRTDISYRSPVNRLYRWIMRQLGQWLKR